MTESPQIRTEVDDRVLKIVVDNVRKKNAFERVMGSDDAKEGILSFVERREARFSGH